VLSVDVVAVGAGTSGAVFVSRLTEDDDRSVLVLEAGGDPVDDQNVNIPILADSVRGTQFDWQHHTVPQQHACLGHVNNVGYVTFTPTHAAGRPCFIIPSIYEYRRTRVRYRFC